MPYTIANPPDWMKNLPAGAIRIGIEAFNSVFRDTGDEDKARIAAWGRIKQEYRKTDDKWVRKLEENMRLNFVMRLPDSIVMDEGTEPVTSMVQIMKTVKEIHPQYGEIDITEEDLDGFVKSFNDNVRGVKIAIDAEHKPEGGASGWIEKLEKVKDKLFAFVEWTSKGVQEVKDKIYLYISPEFDFDYISQSGEKFKNVLYAATLTNRPFLKGMAPVGLSEFSIAQFIEGGGDVKFAEWTRAFINDLPDSAFAYIEPGGEKDEEGKTKPRSLRHFPYKGPDGEVDLPHLRNALARAPQSPFGPKAMPKLRAAAKAAGVGEFAKIEGGVVDVKLEELIKMLKLEEGTKEEDVTKKLEELMKDGDPEVAKKLKELQDSKDAHDADIKKLKEDHEKEVTELKKVEGGVKMTETEINDLKAKAEKGEKALKEIRERNKTELVDGAVAGKKILPAQTDWLKDYFDKDPEGAKKFVETAPVQGIKLKADGSDEASQEEVAEVAEAKEAQKKLEEAITKKRAEKEGMTYKEGLIAVNKENPELVRKAQDNG